MKLLALAADPDATITRIRLRDPLTVLCRDEGWQLAVRPLRLARHEELDAADVLIVQRGITRSALGLIRHMRQGGGHAVYEIDDLLTEPPPQLVHAAALRAGRRWITAALAEADVVSVSTARLAAALQPLARRVELVPAYALPDAPRAAPRRPEAPTTLLIAASDRVDAGFLEPALAELAALRPGRVRLVCVGAAGIATSVPGLPCTQRPLLPRSEFVALAASLQNALALIPLDDSPFSACKSAVKYFDYAAAGVPALCSRLPPYADVIEPGRTGWLVENRVEAWLQALLHALDDPAAAERLAAAAAEMVVQRHSLARTVAAWRTLLRSLGPRRAQPRRHSAAAWLDTALVALRRVNRERLARRLRR
jgi:hypothetical protein